MEKRELKGGGELDYCFQLFENMEERLALFSLAVEDRSWSNGVASTEVYLELISVKTLLMMRVIPECHLYITRDYWLNS